MQWTGLVPKESKKIFEIFVGLGLGLGFSFHPLNTSLVFKINFNNSHILMSTKTSNDLNITRPTSRVIRAPGGSSAGMGDALGKN